MLFIQTSVPVFYLANHRHEAFIDFQDDHLTISYSIQKLYPNYNNAQVHKLIDESSSFCESWPEEAPAPPRGWNFFYLCRTSEDEPVIYRQIINWQGYIDLKSNLDSKDECGLLAFDLLKFNDDRSSPNASTIVSFWQKIHHSRYCQANCPSNGRIEQFSPVKELTDFCPACLQCKIPTPKKQVRECLLDTSYEIMDTVENVKPEVDRLVSIAPFLLRFSYLLLVLAIAIGYFGKYGVDLNHRIHARIYLIALFVLCINSIVTWNHGTKIYSITYYITILLQHIMVAASMIDKPFYDRVTLMPKLSPVEYSYVWSNYLLATMMWLGQACIIQASGFVDSNLHHKWRARCGFPLFIIQLAYTLPWITFIYIRHRKYYDTRMKLARMVGQGLLVYSLAGDWIRVDADEVGANAVAYVLMLVSFFFNLSSHTYEIRLTDDFGHKDFLYGTCSRFIIKVLLVLFLH